MAGLPGPTNGRASIRQPCCSIRLSPVPAYFLKGVVPECNLKDIYLGMMQFMVIQVIGLVLIFVFPQIALWLPTMIYGE